MKQLFQNLKSGQTELTECPYPQCKKGALVIQTRASLISLGTERMLVEFSKSGPIEKIRQQPEKVKQVLDKIKTEGLFPTIQAVQNKLDEPLPLGYCNAGVVLEAGDGVTGICEGDRVISNGPHSEIVLVPKNLVCKIQEGVSFEEASFTVAGSIALQGLRLASPTLGETVVVIGLGLIGQLSIQLAKAQGCSVVAFDIDSEKVSIAAGFGVRAFATSKPVEAVLELTNGIGADSVIITASSSSEEIISQSARMCRKRGKIVLVGVVPLNINRSEFYEKEISFQVSCSYGPGRYDPEYEQAGRDYPLPFVRWTEQRNFEAVLWCIANGSLNVKALISNRVNFENAPEVYATLGATKSIATILVYQSNQSDKSDNKKTISFKNDSDSNKTGNAIAIIGTGNFTKMTMLPALKKAGASIRYICNQSGGTGPHLAKKFNVDFCTTDLQKCLNDSAVNSVVITTRHRSHTDLCLQALEKGKNVFVEKPLAINRGQLEKIAAFFGRNEKSSVALTVGFNRRYSPLVGNVKSALGVPSPVLNMVYTMNAGAIPKSHWTQSEEEGGRIIGEACHCIDLFVYFAQSPVISVCTSSIGTGTDLLSDNVAILLKAQNGSQAVINYFSNGSKRYAKEKIELFTNNTTIVIDNFRQVSFFGIRGKDQKIMSINKGHTEQFKTYIDFLNGKGSLKNSLKEHLNVTEASIAAVESLQKKTWIDLTCVW